MEESSIVKFNKNALKDKFEIIPKEVYLVLGFELGGDFDDSIVSLDLHVGIVVVIPFDVTLESDSHVMRVDSDFDASWCLNIIDVTSVINRNMFKNLDANSRESMLVSIGNESINFKARLVILEKTDEAESVPGKIVANGLANLVSNSDVRIVGNVSSSSRSVRISRTSGSSAIVWSLGSSRSTTTVSGGAGHIWSVWISAIWTRGRDNSRT